MADFFGNLRYLYSPLYSISVLPSLRSLHSFTSSHPNTLSSNLLVSLYSRSGKNVIIRAGGSTANIALFHANQSTAIENHWNGSTNVGLTGANTDQPSLSLLGPAWLESFQTAPNGTSYIYNLNHRDNSPAGIASTIDVAKRVYQTLGSSLYAFELSNEIDLRWNGTFRPKEWGPRMYTEEYLEYTKLFDEQVFDGRAKGGKEPMFQMGTLMGSGGKWINPGWNSVEILGLGINRRGDVKSAAQHDYHGNNCRTTKEIATLRQNLLNHTNVVNRAWPHIQMAPIVDSYGIEYVLGETNSISCQGRDLVSNVFGSALWYLDYSLFIASKTPVSKMYWHMGTPYRYSLWSPFKAEVNNHSAIVRPSYYGALVLSEILGGGKEKGDGRKRQVHAVLEEESLVVYSVHFEQKLESLVILNNAEWNSTQVEQGGRPFIQFELPQRVGGSAVVKRLTAPGANVKIGATWAGQTVSEQGVIEGKVFEEIWRAGEKINVGYSEAVVLWFQD
ncbi:hypothetical protein CC80DRAFT_539628 [Byssothecium circinans]|uniref:Beta-glucuronidase C-terminal domain-containing protein n=1 Tax=Byssothecium circinans TaxID=147558 RepID=A0A6A5THT9_9PLEO|nr:hypothetical protein CC80DRAFT_539628 [Byssothecium circinans]